MAKKIENTEEQIIGVDEMLSKSEVFIEKNQRTLITVVTCVVVLIGAFIVYNKYIKEPKEKEAFEQMYMAEKSFEMDSLNLAIYGSGDGNQLGFIDIIEDYGYTKAGNLANYYLGLCYLRMGEYEDAIDYLEDFSSSDMIIAPLAKGAIGDAYMEMEELGKAADSYAAAASMSDNNFTAPMFLLRAGWAYEEIGDYKSALSVYETIKTEHIKSFESREIDKYIAHAKGSID